MYRAIVLAALLASLCFAQTSTSSISGLVTGSSGAVVPGARVVAAHEQTGVTYEQTTTEAGVYTFPALPVGLYSITVDMRGFKTARSTGNLLQVGSPIVVNVSLDWANRPRP